MNGRLFLFPLFILMLASCSYPFATKENAPAYEARVYGASGKFITYLAWNGGFQGEVWGKHPDGEKFEGEYAALAPELYHTNLSVLLGSVTGGSVFVGVAPSVGSASSNVRYGMISVVGERGTTAVCKFVVTIHVWSWGSPIIGTCLDSKNREYTLHADLLGADPVAQNPQPPPEETENMD